MKEKFIPNIYCKNKLKLRFSRFKFLREKLEDEIEHFSSFLSSPLKRIDF